MEPADPAAAPPAVDLTTVTTTSATFHCGVDVVLVDGLEPATSYEHEGVAFRTLDRPPGALRCRLATVNDVHFGEVEAGRVGSSELGPVRRAAPGALPYPEVMNRSAAAELVALDRRAGLAAVIAKGDLTSTGDAEEFAAFERCYRTPFGARLHAVRGNHDCADGHHEYAGDRWIELDGVAVALLDTTVPGHGHGHLDESQLDWLDALTAAADDPVIVMGHHPQYLGAPGDDATFSLTAQVSRDLDDVFRRRPAIVAYTAGHTHRHRVQTAGRGIPSIEVGCVKDFPGSWAEYEVYDGGILQIAHRISSPEALKWSERCRDLYADFGIDYSAYALGDLADRCFLIPVAD